MRGFRFQVSGFVVALLLCASFSVNAVAADKMVKPAPAPEKKAEQKKPGFKLSPECDHLAQQVRDAIGELGKCWQDSDCTTVSLGCPWQFAPCDQTIISRDRDEQDKNLTLVKLTNTFREKCVMPNADYAAACQQFNDRVVASACTPLEVMCVNGKCMTQIDSILQDPEAGKKFKAGRIAPDDVIKKINE